jgi:hypothetical protein
MAERDEWCWSCWYFSVNWEKGLHPAEMLQDEHGNGWCYRYPPPLGTSPRAAPRVSARYGCGEWRVVSL